MADVDIVVQAGAGVPPTHTPTYTSSLSAADVYIVPNDGRTKIHFKKGTGSASVVTFITPATYRGLAVADPTLTVAISTEQFAGTFDPDLFGATLKFSLTNEANMSFAALRW